MGRPLKVTAIMAAPLVGEPPHLDAILEYVRAAKAESIERDDPSGRHSGLVAWRERLAPNAPRHSGYFGILSRSLEPPPLGILPIAIEREQVGSWPIAKCSSPIYLPHYEYVEHTAKRISVGEVAVHIDQQSGRQSIHHGTGGTKAYFRPLHCLVVERIVWFCVGYGGKTGRRPDGSIKRRSSQGELMRMLRLIDSIGAERQAGYGRVAEWVVDPWDDDWSWFAPSPNGRGRMLMRPLPSSAVPDDVVGARPTYASVCPPYWHPKRHVEAMVPC